MRWPRGRWNGQRIVGVNVKVAIDVTRWRWKPVYIWYVGGLHWLCFLTWWNWEYEASWLQK